MIYQLERSLETTERGGHAKALGRRVSTWPTSSSRFQMGEPGQQGFTLIELVITITVLTIMTLAVVPLLKVSVKRQKEEQLRAALRQMRMAIDDFHRDTMGMTCQGTSVVQNENQQQRTVVLDPRSKVMITDCTIFGVDNPDRYPPDLETLVNGVNVRPRAGAGMGGRGDMNVNATDVGSAELSTKKKVYLRSIPVNPMTGEKDWDFRSTYDDPDSSSWGGENVFDVIFPSDKDQYFKPMKDNDKYSDW